MRRNLGVLLILLSGLCAPAIAQTAPPSASEADRKLLSALDSLDSWLGNSNNAARWRRFLLTESLRSQLRRGAEADAKVVAAAHARYTAKADGLELPQFAAVRDAIGGWLAASRAQQAPNLPKLALSMAPEHRPITDAQFNAARSELTARATALEQFLASNPRQAENWKRYLKWNQLQPHLAAGFEANRRSLNQLDEVLRRLRANQPGLELPAFVDLAKAVARYRALASWGIAARTRDSAEVYQQLMQMMSAQLERHIERPTTETTWQVGRMLGIIDGLGQSSELVSAVRHKFVRPNVEAIVSANFIKRMPQRRAGETRPVRDCILGTRIIGSAYTTTQVEYALGSSTDSVALAIHLQGAANSNNNGYNGPVRVKTRGLTTYQASSLLYLNDAQFTASPVQATADTNTRIQSINKTGGQFGAGLIEKIAWRRAGEQKGQAERISSRHTEERVEREFTETVERDLSKLRQRYESEVRAPLIRRGIQPDYLRMQSDPQAAEIGTLLAARNQLGADRDPPEPMAGSDVSLQVHESAVNNYLVLALANARISQEEANVAPSLQGDVPNWIKALAITRPRLAAAAATGAAIVEEAQETIEEVVEGQDDEREEGQPTAPPFKPFSITLNGDSPIGVRFDDGKLVVRVRASRLASDDAEYANWDFIVTYQISTEDGEIMLRRVGDIEVFPTGFDPAWDKQLTAQQSGFRSTLAKNMNARARAGGSFPNEIPIAPIRTTRFGTLLLHQLQADDGWLTISWLLPPTESLEPLAPPRPGATVVR